MHLQTVNRDQRGETLPRQRGEEEEETASFFMPRHCEYSFVSCFPTPASCIAKFWSGFFLMQGGVLFLLPEWIPIPKHFLYLSVPPPCLSLSLLPISARLIFGVLTSFKVIWRQVVLPFLSFFRMCMGRMQPAAQTVLLNTEKTKKSFAIYNCLTHICNGHLHTCAKTQKTFPVAYFWHFIHLKKRKNQLSFSHL